MFIQMALMFRSAVYVECLLVSADQSPYTHQLTRGLTHISWLKSFSYQLTRVLTHISWPECLLISADQSVHSYQLTRELTQISWQEYWSADRSTRSYQLVWLPIQFNLPVCCPIYQLTRVLTHLPVDQIFIYISLPERLPISADEDSETSRARFSNQRISEYCT
jgi:hypothetical protein